MSSCYCDYEPASWYWKTTPVARKPHRCGECGSVIVQGERYERVTGIWDGQFQVYLTCPDCLELRDHLSDMECFCWSHGGLWEDIVGQFENADFKIGERFAYLRMVAEHRCRKRKRHVATKEEG